MGFAVGEAKEVLWYKKAGAHGKEFFYNDFVMKFYSGKRI
jgi:hypothetical protein